MSDATSGNARRSPRPGTAPLQQQQQRQHQQNREQICHHSRLRNVSAAIETRNGICDTVVECGSEESINGRMDMLNSINTELHNVSAKLTDSKPYRIGDLLPRNWETSNGKEDFRSFTSDLHLWMQSWSNQGEILLVSVESTDKFDSSTIAFDCSDEQFRSIEALLHRTTANEPLRTVQQIKGQKGFEAWPAIVRRYDQRNMSDNTDQQHL